MNYNLEVLITEEEIQKKVLELADQINKDYAGETITLVGILTGGVMFMVDLAKRINVEVVFDFIDISSYGEKADREKNSDVKLNRDLLFDIEGKNILIVEDIVDTGKSLKYLQQYLKLRKPKTVKLCSLLNKPSKRLVENLKIDYLGFDIENKFVVGYGLDYDQKLRNLPYIGVVK